MARRRPGDSPLCEPLMVKSLMHICVIRPQWVYKPLSVQGKYYREITAHDFLLRYHSTL